MRWLYRIVARLAGCRHKWRTKQTIGVYDDDDDMPIGHKRVCRCSRCGAWTSFRV